MAILLIKSEKHGNKEIILDDNDLKIISGKKWSISGDGKYAVGNAGKTYMHRLILSAKKNDIVDHKNLNTFDNRKTNLRFSSASGNVANKNKINKKCSSIYKGVVYDKSRDKWHCRVGSKNFGRFNTEIEAAKKYNEMGPKIFGKFFRPNIIKEKNEQSSRD